MSIRILATVMKLLRGIGGFSGLSCRYSSDSRSSRFVSRRVSLGLVSSQVSDLWTRIDDLKWITATISDQLESVNRRLADLEDMLREGVR